MRKISEGKNVQWQLFEDDNGKLVLMVICGDIGLYEEKVNLSDRDIELYKNNGEDYLDKLAKKISKESGMRPH
ncbi:hypothetical protein [Consotaella aegiceratis]|uniref:hypothetical protein n=1 Tax=Consotaella aegiceratis TaxID=3097961 RepID=UPI002F3FD562